MTGEREGRERDLYSPSLHNSTTTTTGAESSERELTPGRTGQQATIHEYRTRRAIDEVREVASCLCFYVSYCCVGFNYLFVSLVLIIYFGYELLVLWICLTLQDRWLSFIVWFSHAKE
jgi:hypothetical protein